MPSSHSKGGSRFVTVSKAATLIGCSSNTVRALCDEGTLKTAQRYDSGWRRIDKDSIESYLGLNSRNGSSSRKVCIYGRKSTRHAADIKGLEEQIGEAVEHCRNCGLIETEDDYVVLKEYGVSGTSLDPYRRKAFFEVLEGVIEHRFSHVCVLHPERLVRLPGIMDLLRFWFAKHGCDLVFVHNFDISEDSVSEMKEAIDLFLSWIQALTNRATGQRNKWKRERMLTEEDLEFLIEQRKQGKTLVQLSELAELRGIRWFNRQGDSGTLNPSLLHKILAKANAQVKGKRTSYQEEFEHFVSDCCIRTDNQADQIESAELHKAYQSWAKSKGLLITSQSRMGVAITKMGIEKTRKHVNHRNFYCYLGLRLREEEGC